MKTVDMAKENNFLLREAAKAARMGYYDHLSAGGKGDPAEERWIEALTAGADAITKVAVLESRLAQAERERDAAVEEIKRLARCQMCSFVDERPETCLPYPMCHECLSDCPCAKCIRYSNFKWRGICPEHTKEVES